jgi:hypothetical protein
MKNPSRFRRGLLAASNAPPRQQSRTGCCLHVGPRSLFCIRSAQSWEGVKGAPATKPDSCALERLHHANAQEQAASHGPRSPALLCGRLSRCPQAEDRVPGNTPSLAHPVSSGGRGYEGAFPPPNPLARREVIPLTTRIHPHKGRRDIKRNQCTVAVRPAKCVASCLALLVFANRVQVKRGQIDPLPLPASISRVSRAPCRFHLEFRLWPAFGEDGSRGVEGV